MGTERDEDPFAIVDRLLDQQMLKHFEMAQMIGDYRDMLADLQEQRQPDSEMVKLARSLLITAGLTASLAIGHFFLWRRRGSSLGPVLIAAVDRMYREAGVMRG